MDLDPLCLHKHPWWCLWCSQRGRAHPWQPRRICTELEGGKKIKKKPSCPCCTLKLSICQAVPPADVSQAGNILLSGRSISHCDLHNSLDWIGSLGETLQLALRAHRHTWHCGSLLLQPPCTCQSAQALKIFTCHSRQRITTAKWRRASPAARRFCPCKAVRNACFLLPGLMSKPGSSSPLLSFSKKRKQLVEEHYNRHSCLYPPRIQKKCRGGDGQELASCKSWFLFYCGACFV